MKRNIETLLADTLFNPNVRPSTKKSLLVASLEAMKAKPEIFFKHLEKESSNPDNIEADQRERDRNPVDGTMGLKEKELNLLQGKGLEA